MASLEDKLPLSGSQLATLDDEAVQDLDQFVLRFGRLQDAIGARLLPAVQKVSRREPGCCTLKTAKASLLPKPLDVKDASVSEKY
ncbi:MAG: hypothetical protein ACQEUC_04590 [Pseudomonadota bacterium]